MNMRPFYAEQLPDLRGSGANMMARCPFHEDRSPSLSINVESGLFNCHGCGRAGSPIDFIKFREQLSFEDALTRLGERYAPTGIAEPRIVATYDYEDEHGELLFQVVRFAAKDFRQRTPDGHGGWSWSTKGVRRVPYKLPLLIETVADNAPVYIVEGEKDVENLLAWDGAHAKVLAATCNPGGAGKWRPEYNEYFRGARVVIVADRDEVGRKHAWHVHDQLAAMAASIRVVEAAAGKDLTDHLAAGFTLEQLVEARRIDLPASEAEPGGGSGARREFSPALIDVSAAMTEAFRPIPYRIQPYLAAPDNLLIGGEWGSGKSPLALSLAFSLALNTTFLASVVPTGEANIIGILDDENGDHLIRQRLQLLGRGLGIDPATAGQRIVYCGRSGWRDLTATDRKDALARVIEERGVTRLVLDSLVRFIGGRDENASSDMSGWYEEVVLWLNTQLDVRVVAIHHWRKPSKDQNDPRHRFRGSSDIPAQFDQVWAYEITPGPNARNLLHLRSRWGEVAGPVTVRREGGIRDGSMKLVALGGKTDTEGLLWSTLLEAGSAGELREKLILRLLEAGVGEDAADQACTRTLGRWKALGRVISCAEGRKARYWVAEAAPASLFSGAQGIGGQ